MNILVITRSPWDDENGLGNTMSNLFEGYPSKNIANLYFRNDKPKNQVCNKYLSISDKDVVKGIINPKYTPGKIFKMEHADLEASDSLEQGLISYVSKKQNILPFLIQNQIWNNNLWSRKKLDDFLDKFQPDIIFYPSFHTIFTHKLLKYIQKRTNAKVVVFHTDDYLNPTNFKDSTLKRYYFVDRYRAIINSINLADINYCISEKQKIEYEALLNKKFKVLTKGSDFSHQPTYTQKISNSKVIKIVYIGSLIYGRWKTVKKLVEQLKNINKNSDIKFELDIYSQYTPDSEILNDIVSQGISTFKGKIPYEKVKEKIKEYDMVLYLESFSEQEMNDTRLSFSTKIVDYLNSGRSILAIGPKNLAGMEYLKNNDAAICINKISEIPMCLSKINSDPHILKKYADNSWKLGKRNHDINKIRENLIKDFESII